MYENFILKFVWQLAMTAVSLRYLSEFPPLNNYLFAFWLQMKMFIVLWPIDIFPVYFYYHHVQKCLPIWLYCSRDDKKVNCEKN